MEEGQRWSLKDLIAWMVPGRNIILCTSQEIWVNLQSLFCLINPGKIFSKVIFIKIKYSKYSKLSSRLDWQMWFAALGSYGHNPWFISLLYRILESKNHILVFLKYVCRCHHWVIYQNIFPVENFKVLLIFLYLYLAIKKMNNLLYQF